LCGALLADAGDAQPGAIPITLLRNLADWQSACRAGVAVGSLPLACGDLARTIGGNVPLSRVMSGSGVGSAERHWSAWKCRTAVDEVRTARAVRTVRPL
jgi:hypothetical protein